MHKPIALAAMMFASVVGCHAFAQDSKVDIKPLDGASSLSETHGDWVINCEVVNNAKQCRMSQQQFSAENNNQRLLAIEFLPAKDGVLNGTLAMPFGLALARAVSMSVDDAKIGEPAPFTTCYMVGCVVPLRLEATSVAQLSGGTVLGLEASTADTQQPVRFKISLKGFASALGKLQKLNTQ
jgi:invasion protein IalB